MVAKVRQVEYYRLWPGDSGDSSKSDADFVGIATDTPDDQIGQMVAKAVAAIRWRGEPPVITGIYIATEAEEGEDENHG